MNLRVWRDTHGRAWLTSYIQNAACFGMSRHAKHSHKTVVRYQIVYYCSVSASDACQHRMPYGVKTYWCQFKETNVTQYIRSLHMSENFVHSSNAQNFYPIIVTV